MSISTRSSNVDALAAAYLSAANDDARDQAFEALMGSMRPDLDAIARKGANSVGRPDAEEDLRQDINEAIFGALRRFDPASGSFQNYALSTAKSQVEKRKHFVGVHPVLPDEDPLRLARLATRAWQQWEQTYGEQPSLAEWRESMRLEALAEAKANGAADPVETVRRLNLNAVDPEKAILDAGMGTVWLDQLGAEDAPQDRVHPALAVLPAEAPGMPHPPLALLTEVMAAEAVREARRRRDRRRRIKSGAVLAAELRRAEVLRELLLKRLSLPQAKQRTGLPLATLRKWQGECLHDIRDWHKKPERMAAFEAEARALARVRSVEALAPAPLQADSATPGLRQFALLCTLAASTGGGSSVEGIFEALAGHYPSSETARQRMLKRDVEDLRALGWPVVSLYRGVGEPWYVLAPPRAALGTDFELSAKEAKALNEALNSPGALGLPPESRQALRRLLGLRSPLPQSVMPGVARTLWAVLLNAIEQRRACDLAWGDGKGRRSVSPYGWVSRGARTFVLLLDHSEPGRGVQAVDLDDLMEARDTASAFIPAPSNFNAQRWALEKEPWYQAAAKAKVRLAADDAAWARQRWPFVAATEGEQGSWELLFYVEEEEAFIDFLLKEFGSKASLVEGAPSLRRKLAARIRGAR